jgi:hypothetical protein
VAVAQGEWKKDSGRIQTDGIKTRKTSATSVSRRIHTYTIFFKMREDLSSSSFGK